MNEAEHKKEERAQLIAASVFTTWLTCCQELDVNPESHPKPGVYDDRILAIVKRQLRYPSEGFVLAIRAERDAQAAVIRNAVDKGRVAYPRFAFVDLEYAILYRLGQVSSPRQSSKLLLADPNGEAKKSEEYDKSWEGRPAEVWNRQVPKLIQLAENLGFAMRLDKQHPGHWKWLMEKVDRVHIGRDVVYPIWRERVEFAIKDAKLAAKEVRRSPDASGRVFFPTEPIAVQFEHRDGSRIRPDIVEKELGRLFGLHGVGNRKAPSYANLFTLECLKAYRDEFMFTLEDKTETK